MRRLVGFGFVGIVLLLSGLVSQAQEAATFDASINSATVTGSGTANYLPIWKTTSILGNSAVYQAGSGANARVGITTTTPLATLDVNGSTRVRGNLTLFGSLNSSLRIQGNAPGPCSHTTSANLVGGFNNNAVTNGVTGATIAGGGGTGAGVTGNLVTDDYGTVSGGSNNVAGNNSGTTCDAPFATVAGGALNTASGNASVVSGGAGNTASGSYATIVGGNSNIASGSSSTVTGGYWNTASGNNSVVAGGGQSIASGANATVPGGSANKAAGNNSFAAGWAAIAADSGSFVWCADAGNPCTSVGANSFQVAVYGPIYFFDGPGGSGCSLSAGGGSWNCSSDRNLKDDITAIDARALLERVANLPITQWRMKGEPAGLKHIGPMAQDFYAAFGLGDNDRYIALGDGQGVALAAIQALYTRSQEHERTKDMEIERLTAQVEQLQERLTRLEQIARK